MSWQTTKLPEEVKAAIDKEASGRFGFSNDRHRDMKGLLVEGAQIALAALEHSSLTELFRLHQQWSLATFPNETGATGLTKLESEVEELWEAISNRSDFGVAEEYVDCIMCLLSSAVNLGINAQMITEAFAEKHERNKNRTWVQNADGTSSHVKDPGTCVSCGQIPGTTATCSHCTLPF